MDNLLRKGFIKINQAIVKLNSFNHKKVFRRAVTWQKIPLRDPERFAYASFRFCSASNFLLRSDLLLEVQ